MSKTILLLATTVTLLLTGLFFARPGQALDPVNKTFFGDVAIDGYDPVAYFEDSKPRKGSKSHTFSWQGAVWRFATADHRDAFAEDPERFAPQYGGYCAWAVSQGYTAGVDPDSWRIVDGKLYLNYSKKVQTRWEKDVEGNIAAADRHWPELVD